LAGQAIIQRLTVKHDDVLLIIIVGEVDCDVASSAGITRSCLPVPQFYLYLTCLTCVLYGADGNDDVLAMMMMVGEVLCSQASTVENATKRHVCPLVGFSFRR